MKRRLFFRMMGGIGGGLLCASSGNRSPSLADFKKASAAAVEDEKYWKLLREQFLLPANYAYFNTGGLGASPFLVLDTVRKAMIEEETHPSPGYDEHLWEEIKKKFATFLGARVKKEEIAFIGSATEGINIILNGLPFKKGDEIIISSHEHVALTVPLLNKIKSQGIVIKVFDPHLANGSANVKLIEKVMNKKTRLVFTSHITCTTGQVMPVKEIGELAKSRGVWYALDGAQALAHFPLDLKDIGVDFYAASGHKWLLGPKRTGILYVSEHLLDTLKPTTVGAYSTLNFDLDKRRSALHPSAQRYEYGTQNEALFYGLGEALDFVNTVGIERTWEHNRKLAETFYTALQKIPGMEILSPLEAAYRSAMISLRVKNFDSSKICWQFEHQGLRVRSVSEANLDAIRVSFHIYNNEEESERLLHELKSLCSV